MDAGGSKSNADASTDSRALFPQPLSIEELRHAFNPMRAACAAPNGAPPHDFGRLTDHSPTHSSPPIAYLVMSASYFRKRARLAGGTLTSPAGAGEAVGLADFAAAEAHIDL